MGCETSRGEEATVESLGFWGIRPPADRKHSRTWSANGVTTEVIGERSNEEQLRGEYADAFTQQELDKLRVIYGSFTSADGIVDVAQFTKILGMSAIPWFAPRLAHALHAAGNGISSRTDDQRNHLPLENGGVVVNATANGAAVYNAESEQLRLSLDAFIGGVAAACRDRRRATLQVIFDVCHEESRRESAAGTSSDASYSEDAALMVNGQSLTISSGSRRLDQHGLHRFFCLSYASGYAAWGHSIELDTFACSKLVRSLAAKVKGVQNESKEGTCEIEVTLEEFEIWEAQNAPNLHRCLSTFLHMRCFPSEEIPQSIPMFKLPQLSEESSLLSNKSAEMFGLAVANQSLQGPWDLLFTTDRDGMSFNRLCHSLLGYGGPTLMLVRDMNMNATFGGFADTPWKESNDFYGGAGCFLLQLEPEFQILQSKPSSAQNYMYLNLKGYSTPHGLGMGGTVSSFRFFISESMEPDRNMAKTSCLTYETGEVVRGQYRQFDIDTIEVWGLGGEDALKARADKRDQMNRALQKIRQVDKKAFLNDFDKGTLLSKTFAHQNGSSEPRPC